MSGSSRGLDPKDKTLFGSTVLPRLQEAVSDFSWLLGRGYSEKAALKLVGDKFSFSARQRMAIFRASCSPEAKKQRYARLLRKEALQNQTILLDAFNIMTTTEVALSEGLILLCQDGCYRDLASVHGSYRKATKTPLSILILGKLLASYQPAHCHWYLDKPVSYSGQLGALLLETAKEYNWPWSVSLVPDPDPILSASQDTVVTSDSVILDHCTSWFNLLEQVFLTENPNALLIDLRNTNSSDS